MPENTRYTLLASATLRQRCFAASRDVGSPGLHRPPHRPQSHSSHRAQSQSRWSHIILGHGRGGVPIAGTTNVLSRDAGAGRGASGDLPVQEARSSPPAPLPSLPSAWSLPARDASHSTSPSRTDGARASWRRGPCLWAHDKKIVPTPHSVEHLVCGFSTEQ